MKFITVGLPDLKAGYDYTGEYRPLKKGDYFLLVTEEKYSLRLTEEDIDSAFFIVKRTAPCLTVI